MRENKKQNTETIDEVSASEEGTKAILNLKKEDIITLSYTKEENAMVFQKQGDTWIYEAQPDFPINLSYLNNMLNIFEALTSLQTEQTAGNRKKYGLENPTYKITAKTSDGTQTTLFIGIKNPVTSDYYACIEGVSDIYTIKEGSVGYFDYTLYDIAKADMFPTVDTTACSEISFYWKGEDTELKILEDSEYKTSDFINWYIISPFEHEIAADANLILTQLQSVADFMYAKLAAFKPTQEQLEEMGMTNPTGKISFAYTEAVEQESPSEELEEASETSKEQTEAASETIAIPKTYTMLIGNKVGEDYYYAMEEGSDKVNLISASTIENVMSYTANDYVYKYFALIDINTVESILLETDGNVYTLENLPESEETQEETATQISEEEEQKEAEIRDFYQTIIDIHREDN